MTTAEIVFDPFSEDFFNGAYETYRRMRDEQPVYYNGDLDFYALIGKIPKVSGQDEGIRRSLAPG